MRNFYFRRIGTLTASVLLAIGLATDVQAAVIVTAAEISGDVVFSTMAGGTLDLTELNFSANLLTGGGVNPAGQVLYLGGPERNVYADIYTGISQPGAFGENFGVEKPSNATGSRFGVSFDAIGGVLAVPTGYISNDPLSATSTFIDETFSSLSLMPGTYVWSWSSDSLTLVIPSPVPIPASAWLLSSAIGLLGLIRRRFQKKRKLR